MYVGYVQMYNVWLVQHFAIYSQFSMLLSDVIETSYPSFQLAHPPTDHRIELKMQTIVGARNGK